MTAHPWSSLTKRQASLIGRLRAATEPGAPGGTEIGELGGFGEADWRPLIRAGFVDARYARPNRLWLSLTERGRRLHDAA